MSTLRLYSSSTHKKEEFIPLQMPAVLLYVCGITPYDHAHIGHGRCYVTFDMLVRILTFLGYNVTYCRNFTDIDDKLLARAERELGDKYRYREIADRYIASFTNNMAELNCQKPAIEPRVTQVIPDIIAFIGQLIAKGYAYEHDGSVYFDIAKFKTYGSLSCQCIDNLYAGARVEGHEGKKNPGDFALWKADAGFWQSPWGEGRPGWHIECSVMAYKYLGATIDIHAGGMDLLFPHHENERAQSEAALSTTFARYWMHNAFVRIHKEKMSKSLGNFFTITDVLARFHPMVLRYYYLSHHYRSPLDFSFDDIEATERAYSRLVRLFEQVQPVTCTAQDALPVVHEMIAALSDDLNVPAFLGLVHEHAALYKDDARVAGQVKYLLIQVLGLYMQPLPEKEVPAEIQDLLREREEARAKKDFARADQLRDEIVRRGYSVQDKKIT